MWGHKELTHSGTKFLTPRLPLHKARVNERRRKMYKSPKIIFAKMAKTCEAFVDKNGEYASLNTNCFYMPRRDVDLKFIGGICNSYVFMFLYNLFFGALRMSGGYYQFQAPQLRVTPVAYTEPSKQVPIIKLVDEILSVKHSDPSAKTIGLEAEIDARVAHLYELTEEEYSLILSELKPPDPFRVAALNFYRDIAKVKRK